MSASRTNSIEPFSCFNQRDAMPLPPTSASASAALPPKFRPMEPSNATTRVAAAAAKGLPLGMKMHSIPLKLALSADCRLQTGKQRRASCSHGWRAGCNSFSSPWTHAHDPHNLRDRKEREHAFLIPDRSGLIFIPVLMSSGPLPSCRENGRKGDLGALCLAAGKMGRVRARVRKERLQNSLNVFLPLPFSKMTKLCTQPTNADGDGRRKCDALRGGGSN